ncbi:hypothetical protein BGX33_011407 [Mortierella sp. NVP41]|nr:hypothetical protein BGX33_011407 [Mortierella sp. NVP41]
MAILDYSKDASKSITLHFHTQELGPKGQPLYYHTPETPAVIKGHVQFQTIKETTASDIVLTFEARAESKWSEEHGSANVSYNHKTRLQEKSWNVKLHRTSPNPKTITPGVTRYDFEIQLDPGLPPSIEGRRGWFHYRFKAHMRRAFPYRDMAVKQLVWVYSSSLRAGEQLEPRIYKQVWSDILPVACILSSDVMYQGQVVPLTIKVDPFLENSIHKGQGLVIVSAIVKMKQYTILRDPRVLDKKRTEKKAVFILPLTENWPQTSEGFTRTIMVDIPSARELAAGIESVPVTKTHKLKLIMMVRTNMSTEKEAKELRFEMDVKITSPRPEHMRDMSPGYADPPPYQSLGQDEESEDNDAMPPGFSRSSTIGRDYQSDTKHPHDLS